ncbi:MAG TPA: hypothetical protein VM638_01550 [Actinomycetota bacterium]|nr:hypothetical protein [Actinomycetota bacterium]
MTAMSGPGATGQRPPLVLVAAILLFVAGVLNLLAAFSAMQLGGAGAIYLLLYLALGAGAIFAGIQILNGREQGRMIGMAVAGVGLVLQVLALIAFRGLGAAYIIIGILLYGVILYALATTRTHFTR